MKSIPRQASLTVAALLCLAFALAATFLNPIPDSDSIEGTLWALSTYESGKLLGPNFYWCYVIPIGGNVFMLPFVAAFGPGLLANCCGMALFMTVLYALALYMITGLTKSTPAAIITLLLLTAVIFGTECFNIAQHILYYGISLCVLFGLTGSFARALRAQSLSDIPMAAVICVTLCLWAGIDGVASVALGVFPAIAALAAVCLITKERNKAPLLMIALGAAGTIAGFALYLLVKTVVHTNGYSSSLGSFALGQLAEIPGNVLSTISAWFFLFFGQERTANVFSSLGDALSLCDAIAGLVLLCILTVSPLILAIRLKNERNPLHMLVLFCFIALSAVCLAECILSARSGMSNLSNLIRFLFCIALYGTATTCLVAERHVNSTGAAITACILLCFCLVAMPLQTHRYAEATQNSINQTVEALEKNNLHSGLSTYWNANVTTVLSNCDVEIAPMQSVNEDDLCFVPFQHNTMKRFYEQPGNEEPYFFVLLKKDELPVIGAWVNAKLGPAAYELHVNDATILVYDASLWTELVPEVPTEL